MIHIEEPSGTMGISHAYTCTVERYLRDQLDK